ncbi:HAAS signaling domain-containing protein [Sphingomonas sp. GB1N7]|uniref:HAAS signaling domain-containing protein n=1 Tax=Parasphingomonas caseinilytica TaxID=3096158 RepID=UPI002FCCAA9A
MPHDESPTEIDHYVRKLLWGLQSLPHEDRLSIAAEIHSHLTDCAAEGPQNLDKARARLGAPHLLAARYVEEYALSGALARTAPGHLLLAVIDRGSRNVGAALAGFGAAMSYLFVLAFAVIAVAKPIMPQNVGLWREQGGALTAGLVATRPSGADELLGPWIVPLAIASALACYLFGTQVLRSVARRLLAAIPR